MKCKWSNFFFLCNYHEVVEYFFNLIETVDSPRIKFFGEKKNTLLPAQVQKLKLLLWS